MKMNNTHVGNGGITQKTNPQKKAEDSDKQSNEEREKMKRQPILVSVTVTLMSTLVHLCSYVPAT